MHSIFLRAKHWQLFIPLVTIPFVICILFAFGIAFSMVLNFPEKPVDILWIFYTMPLISILCGFIQFAWFWNVLTNLKTLVNTTITFPSGRIKLFFFIPIIYLCALPVIVAFVIQSTNGSSNYPASILNLVLPGILIFLLHFFSIFCLIHTIYFSAKIIRCAELQTNAPFSTFAGDFFLIWFFPVGIWFIQPRINALLQKTKYP